MSDFINFFKSGQIGNTNLTDVFTKQLPTTFKKINIANLPPLKPLPPPAPLPKIKIDSKVVQFFEKDVKTFITKDVKGVAVSVGQNFENMLKMPKLMSDLMTNVLGGLNTPFLVPILVVVGAVVLVQVVDTRKIR